MSYTQQALEQKIMDMYPEIKQHNLVMGMTFDEKKNAYIIKFTRGSSELSTHLEKKDADDCMDNVKCVYLGVQVEQFINNFELRK
jgi:hypothetical protein